MSELPQDQPEYHVLPRVPLLRGRQDFIVDRCRGRRTLHLGCVDEGLTAMRLQTGDLLHTRLQAAASDLWGMDISGDGIRLLESCGVDHLVQGNIEEAEDLARLPSVVWETVVLSEVLEHLSNPGAFLDAAHALFEPRTRLILSVPNGLSLTRVGQALGGVELVHPDHNYWFSPTTLTRLLARHGFVVEESYGYSFSAPSLRPQAIVNALTRAVRRPDHQEPAEDTTTSTAPAVRNRAGGGTRLVGLLRSLPAIVMTLALKRVRPWAVSEGIIVVARSERCG